MITPRVRKIAASSISLVVGVLGLLPLAAGAEQVLAETAGEDLIPAAPVADMNPPFTRPGRSHSGTLDPGFGVGGIVTMPWPKADNMGPVGALLIQPDGKILLAGGGLVGTRIIRYLDDGSLDPTFGSGGIATFSVQDLGGFPVGMALLPDGRIVVAGSFKSPYREFIARFNPDGSLDPAFGSGGYVVVGPIGTTHGLYAMALQPDGKILVGGQAVGDFYLQRFHEDGGVDAGFGDLGWVTTSFPMVNGAQIRSILLQPDGRIIAAGMGYCDVALDWAVMLARYEPDGALDTGFGSGGTLHTDIFGGARWAALQADGRIVLAGRVDDSLGADMAIARLLSDGMLDTSFGDGGVARVDFNDESNAAEAGVLRADGRLVVGGFAFYVSKPGQTPASAFGLAGFLPNGELDRTFGRGGTVAVALGHTSLRAMAQQSDGGILAAGDTVDQDTQIWSYFLARFRTSNSGPVN